VDPCARGGKSRARVAAVDHALQPAATRTPVGLVLPTWDARGVEGVTATGTSAGLVARLAQWWEAGRERFAPRTTLGIPGENGPENPRRRTQGMQRWVACVPQDPVRGRRASSPPSPSKDHPLERCWGIWETHGHGSLLEAIDPVLQVAATRTWQGTHPLGALVTTTYQTGVTLPQEAMEAVEATIKRLPHVGKWFVDIVPAPRPLWDP
jgi:hypothetical protein